MLEYKQNISKYVPVRIFDQGGVPQGGIAFGSSSTNFEVYSAGYLNQDPNRKTGKHGLLAVGIRNDTNGEFRGRWRYSWNIPGGWTNE